MDLENMKETWLQMSQELENQKKLTNEIILKMTQEKSSSRLNRIVNLELFGDVITVAMLVYLLANFNKLTNWLTITGGVLMTIILILALFMSYQIITKAKRIDVVRRTYNQTLIDFRDLTRTLRNYKWISIGLNILMPFLILPVVSAIVFDKDLLNDFDEFAESLIYSFLLIPPLLYLIIRFYKKNISKVREAINEIEE